MKGAADVLVHSSQWVLTASMLSAGLVALIVLLQRTLKERLIPGWSCLLWGLVLLRLLVPWSPESRFSIMPSLFAASSVQPVWQETSPVTPGLQTAVGQVPLPPAHIWVFIWLAGAAACAAYTLWGSWRFARIMNRRTVPVHDADMLALFAECRTVLNVRRPVGLVAAEEGVSPALYGLLKPRVMIPAPLFTTLDSEKLRHIMLHELAHAKRHDIALNWLMHLVLSIHWFNPVLWFAAGRLRQDQEMASDALAMDCLAPERRLSYGHTLIHMLEAASQSARPASNAGNVYLTGSAKQLQRRMKMIKRHRTHSRFLSLLAIAGILLVGGCVLTEPEKSADPANSVQSAPPASSPSPSASASPPAASAQPVSSPSPSLEPAGQTAAGTKDAAASVPQAAPAASPAQSGGAVTQPARPAVVPSDAVSEIAPERLVPRAVPASELAAESQSVQESASPAPAAPQIVAPALIAEEGTPKPVPGP